jgi:hypothetical protein
LTVFVLVRNGRYAVKATNPDEVATYQTRSDAEIAAKHASSKGWKVEEVADGDGS